MFQSEARETPVMKRAFKHCVTFFLNNWRLTRLTDKLFVSDFRFQLADLKTCSSAWRSTQKKKSNHTGRAFASQPVKIRIRSQRVLKTRRLHRAWLRRLWALLLVHCADTQRHKSTTKDPNEEFFGKRNSKLTDSAIPFLNGWFSRRSEGRKTGATLSTPHFCSFVVEFC